MKFISSHQSCFAPYIGYWHKVINSEEFIINNQSQFSKNSFYYRTFMPKINLNDLSYIKVPIQKQKNIPIYDVKLKLDYKTNLKKRFDSIFELYQNEINVNIIKDLVQKFWDFDFKYLYEVNNFFFDLIYNYLELSTKIYQDFDSKTFQHLTTSERIGARLANISNQQKYVYISGQSSVKYFNINEFKKYYKGEMVCQFVRNDFYHGSILHYLMTKQKTEIIPYINSRFGMK